MCIKGLLLIRLGSETDDISMPLRDPLYKQTDIVTSEDCGHLSTFFPFTGQWPRGHRPCSHALMGLACPHLNRMLTQQTGQFQGSRFGNSPRRGVLTSTFINSQLTRRNRRKLAVQQSTARRIIKDRMDLATDSR